MIGGYAIFEFRDKDGGARRGQGVHAACISTTCRAGKAPASSRHGRSRPGNACGDVESPPTPDASVRQAQSAAMTAADIHRTILAVWRIEQPRLITGLSRMLRDVTLAEDLTQEALVAALEHWPATGVPEKPGAWLMATAKRRALDELAPPQHARAQTRDADTRPGAGAAGDARSGRRRWTTSSATSCCG